ncbi:hypothetical protein Tco_1527512, partial [Tanacetum coccineum]
MGYSDYQMGNVTISRVYYVEGLGHNLFSVGQFCDFDLEAAFHKHTCYIHDLEGADLLKGSRDSNLYTLSLEDMMLYSPIYLLSKASKTNSWLWHRRKPDLSHLYVFGTLCYPTNDSEDLDKLKPKADVGIFIGYAPAKKSYRISGPGPQLLTPGTLSSGLVPNPPSLTPVDSLVPAFAAPEPADSTDTLPPVIPSGVEEEYHDIEVAHLDNDPFFGAPISDINSEESSSRDVILT